MRVSIVFASAAALVAVAGVASAHGMIRSGGLSPNHSALSIGQSGISLSSRSCRALLHRWCETERLRGSVGLPPRFTE